MLKWPLEWRSFFFFLGSVYCCLLFFFCFFVFLTLPCSFFLFFSFLFVTFWQSCGSAEGVLWLNYQLTVLLEDKIDVVCLQPWYNALWFTRLKALTNFLSSSFLLPILSLPLPPSLYLCLSLSRSVCLSACLSVSVSLSLSLSVYRFNKDIALIYALITINKRRKQQCKINIIHIIIVVVVITIIVVIVIISTFYPVAFSVTVSPYYVLTPLFWRYEATAIPRKGINAISNRRLADRWTASNPLPSALPAAFSLYSFVVGKECYLFF